MNAKNNHTSAVNNSSAIGNDGLVQQPTIFTNGKFQPSKKITSLEIAEISGMLHKNLLQSIRLQEVAWTKTTGLKFQPSKYKDVSGKLNDMYELSKSESLYISSKFNDEVRARLVIRWFELENNQPKRGVKLYNHEKPLFDILNQWLVRGDIKRVAIKLNVGAGSVSRVKRGIFRSQRIMEALIERCKFNKTNNIVEGYQTKFAQLSLNFFNPQKTLAL